MGISEKKMKIVIENYFKAECNINTTIHDAFEKGFRIGVQKGISAQPTPHWIPCSERLPEKYGNYLVTTDDGEVDIGCCDPENKDRQDHFWSGCDADGFFWYGENIVIAWMPLPEPYQEDEQDESI